MLSEKFGEPSELVRKKVKPEMDAMVRDFIAHAPFAVLATANAAGDCDASPRGGTPGFFKVYVRRPKKLRHFSSLTRS